MARYRVLIYPKDGGSSRRVIVDAYSMSEAKSIAEEMFSGSRAVDAEPLDLLKEYSPHADKSNSKNSHASGSGGQTAGEEITGVVGAYTGFYLRRIAERMFRHIGGEFPADWLPPLMGLFMLFLVAQSVFLLIILGVNHIHFVFMIFGVVLVIALSMYIKLFAIAQFALFFVVLPAFTIVVPRIVSSHYGFDSIWSAVLAVILPLYFIRGLVMLWGEIDRLYYVLFLALSSTSFFIEFESSSISKIKEIKFISLAPLVEMFPILIGR